MEDPRTARTLRAIHQSCIDLMETKPFSRITVIDLCHAADINRSTFYHHYEDIVAFRRAFLLHVAEGLTLAVSSHGSNDNLLLEKDQALECYTAWFSFIRDNGRVFELLLGPNGTPDFSTLLMQRGIDWYRSLLQSVRNLFEQDVPVDIVATYLIGAHMGLMRFYLDHRDECTAQDMAKRLVYLSYSGVLNLLGIPDIKVGRPSLQTGSV